MKRIKMGRQEAATTALLPSSAPPPPVLVLVVVVIVIVVVVVVVVVVVFARVYAHTSRSCYHHGGCIDARVCVGGCRPC
jgi:hypothetical protein